MNDPDITVRKIGYTMPVSCCLLTAYSDDINYCKHPKPPPPSRWELTRWRLRDWWWRNKPTIHRGPCEVDE